VIIRGTDAAFMSASLFASFDRSTLERGQHAICPHRAFDPPPLLVGVLSDLLRLGSHCRRFFFMRCAHIVSTFLRPLAPAVVTRLRTDRALLAHCRFACATMDALTAICRGSSDPACRIMNSASGGTRLSRVTRTSL
jgi:hypothetical protein